mmetsp:Transcript_20399/g.28385  ORF Transcript_20399/g.28385 Transcript_20399/m.28385 type:complete len:574 (+) Transcript_20399:317-2038(+)
MASEEAPPAPAIGPPSETPMPYMTPHQMKNRLSQATPSVYNLTDGVKSSNAVFSKTYRTTSTFIQFGTGNVNTAEAELERIINSVSKTLDALVDDGSGNKDIISLTFEPEGCVWTMEVNESFAYADEYVLKTTCHMSEKNEENENNYVVETVVETKSGEKAIDKDSSIKDIQAAYEDVQLQVRKAVVRCEFPEFKEGCKGRPFREVYQLNARLKSGSFATVCRGTHRATGKKVAIKCVLRKDLPASDDAAIFDEVAILASLRHPHVCPLLDFFDEKDCYFLVMELMAGGDLFDRIGAKKSYTEADARDLCVKMLQAMAYVHSKKIAHCDMKPKNLLLVSDESDNDIKFADFGFAARVYEPKTLTKQCGTPFFVSPEILMREKYDQQSDMWSVGCIIYLLLGGNLPFMGRSQKELFRAIVVGKYEFPSDCGWDDVSDEAKDLISKLLVTDPDKRMTAKEALEHTWITAQDDLLQARLIGASKRLKTYNARMKLRSAMIAVDWVSSISRRMSWMSTQKKNSATGSGAGGGLAGMAMALTKMKINEGDEKVGEGEKADGEKTDSKAEETAEEKPKE